MSSENETTRVGRRFPPWLRKRLAAGGRAEKVRSLLAGLRLKTVCSSANCPNRPECFSRGTATFMILGDTCTRSCRFCAVESGAPADPASHEPQAVAQACAALGLKHVVITSVTRDDLSDGGADHFAKTIGAVRNNSPGAIIEVLTPDFLGSANALDAVLDAGPDVFNHNIETVRRLYPRVRPQADYARSLNVLARAKRRAARKGTKLAVKSGMMVGLGESGDEVRDVMLDLREAGCDMLTIGQYLAPSPTHAPVARFVVPDEFSAHEAYGRDVGFSSVAAGPFVRSSYRAQEAFEAISD